MNLLTTIGEHLPDINLTISAILALLTGIGGFISGRRKSKAETALLNTQNLDGIRVFYEKVLSDSDKRLDSYLKELEDVKLESKKLQARVDLLARLVDRILVDTCSKPGCRTRLSYTPDIIAKLYEESNKRYKLEKDGD